MGKSLYSKISKKIKEKAKQEKGGITLFVLGAMFFYLSITLLVYVGIENKKQSQIDNIEQIQKEYQVLPNQIDDIYESIKDRAFISVSLNENGHNYKIAKGGKVDIQTNITIRETGEARIRTARYGWSNSKTEEPITWLEIKGEITRCCKKGNNCRRILFMGRSYKHKRNDYNYEI